MRTLLTPASIVILMSGLLAGGLLSGSASAEDPTPCKATSFKIDKVKAACADGGQAKVKTMMKAAVKKAKAAGETMNCKTCHTSLKTYELTGDDPVGEINKWL
ncbi:MAG: hypothetical protein AB1Z98_22140 [Nannocystaceae bacterium]